ncbi:hypothetical protein AB4874_10905 [Thioclava sp. 15-R06ZXC-3]|uniref:Porin domain-containing protein n=1 Tax=Thioclava arctica TaxID=3238301 RepID=A0ABV3TKV6_9RHOB
MERIGGDVDGFFGTSLSGGGADLSWRKTKDGVSFVQAIDVGEWLAPEGAAINSLHLGAMNLAPLHLEKDALSGSGQTDDLNVNWDMRVSATTDRMPPTTTGAYKNMRIGFRMVYELDL